MVEFLPYHWRAIKEYAGIYHITTNWDFKRIDNNGIDKIISYIPKNNSSNSLNNSFDERIKYIWKNINKSKLVEVYNEFKFCLCPFRPNYHKIGESYPCKVLSKVEMCEVIEIGLDYIKIIYDMECEPNKWCYVFCNLNIPLNIPQNI